MKKLLFFTLCCALSLTVAAQGTRPVRGVVFNSDGIPMSGVTLTAVGSTDSKVSGADGTFDMMVSPYTKFIEASKEGFISAQAEVDGSYLVFKLQVDKKYAENKAKAEEEARKAAEEEKARLAAEAEAARLAAEKAEQERKAAEAKAKAEEEKRIAAEKAAAEKAEKERLAAEAKAKAEEERRLAAEKAAAEKAEAAKRAAEEKARIAEEKRIAAEKAAAEKAERERLAAEKKRRIEEEKKRIAEEKARLAEQQRLALEKAKAEVKAIKSGDDDAARQAQLEQERLKELEQQAILEQKRQREAELLRQKEQKAEVRKAHIEKWQQASLKGYRSMVEFAFMMDIDLMPSYNLHYIGGYQINNCLFVGVGTGLHIDGNDGDRYAQWTLGGAEQRLPLNLVNVPVFAYFRANFVNRRCSPFFAVAAGYRLSTRRNIAMPWGLTDDYWTYGLIVNPQLGLNFRITPKSSVYIAVGGNMQHFPILAAEQGGQNSDGTYSANISDKLYFGFDFRLGFTF